MSNPVRIYYLDHLRALAVLSLVPYHAIQIYDWGPYFIKYDELATVDLVAAFQLVWLMPLLFLAAGAAAFYSLQKRDVISFYRERILRLMIPFAIGVCLLMPFNGYFTYMANTGTTLSFYDYLPLFFEIESLRGYEGQFSVGHLWFLGFLTGFCIFAPLIKELVARLQDRFESVSVRTSVLVLLLVFGAALVISRVSMWPYPNPFYFATFFVAGIFLYAVPGMANAVLTHRRSYLAAGFVTLAIFFFVRYTFSPPPSLGVENYDGLWWYEAVRAVNGMFWVLAFLGYGQHLLSARFEPLLWVNRHGLWIFVIHLPLVTFFAFVVQPYAMSSYSKLLTVIGLSYMATIPLAMLALQLENMVTRRGGSPSDVLKDDAPSFSPIPSSAQFSDRRKNKTP